MLAHGLRFEPKVILDHLCPGRPKVTDIRGSLVVGALRLVKDAGYYEDYLKLVPPERHEVVQFSLATSWISASVAGQHFNTIDNLRLSDSEINKMGERLGAHILDNLFATMVRTARSAGADAGAWFCLKQCDRIWGRIYLGGGCTVIQTGPKDAILEAHGLPFAESRCFRMMHASFMRGMMMMVTRVCVVKPVKPREPRPDRFAVSLSWV